MRKPEDIKKFMEKFDKEDFFGVIAHDCIRCLPYDAAAEYISDDVTADDWDALYLKNEEEVISEIIKYLPFAYKKAENERGLLAIRSLQHFLAWFYCLGVDEMVSTIHYMMNSDYAPYGMPILQRIEKWLRDNGHLEGELDKDADN